MSQDSQDGNDMAYIMDAYVAPTLGFKQAWVELPINNVYLRR